MAIVVKALILCGTDHAQEALQGAFAALNSGSFETKNPIIDFALGIEQTVAIDANYRDGEFIALVPGAEFLTTANAASLPI